ncbi:MAG: glycosyltransferase family 4 protein [Sulfolobales archaeon]|nr:glycosyltransferase family 4 protein [Sulfolobales archaeon]
METLRILHVVPTIRAGGVAEVWINLTKEFARLGHEVHLVGPYVEEVKDYTVSHREAKVPSFIKDPFYALAYTMLNAATIGRILRNERVDAVLTHGPLVLSCLKVGIECFSVVQGTYSNECRFMMCYPISGIDKLRYVASIRLTYVHEMNLYRCATARGAKLIAVSENTRKELVKCGVKSSNVYAILNGVDKTRFKAVDKNEAREFLERKYRVKFDGFVIAHVGPGARKGTHTLVKALAMLRKANIKFTALFCGKLGPKSYRKYLEVLVNGFNLSGSSISFLG